jgi:hypothetical protein
MSRFVVLASALLLMCPPAAAGQTSTARKGARARVVPWTVVVSGGEQVVDLPDLEGGALVTLVIGRALQLTGAHREGKLDIALPARDGLTPGSYAPVKFAITWNEANVICSSAPGLQVTITATDPVRGTYQGPVRCRSRADASVAFDASVSGVLQARGRRSPPDPQGRRR